MKIKKSQDKKLKIFRDIGKNGKNRKWRERKLKNIELGKMLEKLGYKQFSSVYQCSETLIFSERKDGTKKLKQAYFCKNKLCSLCNWRKSLKYSYNTELIITKALEKEPKGRFLFLTLTVKNVDNINLESELTKISRGFHKLIQYKKIDKTLIGYMRSTEITYNRDNENYHPHVHCLLFVKSTYFTKENRYITQEEWTNYWKKAMNLDYKPIVDVRVIKDKHNKGLKNAILETSKYPVKPFDTLENNLAEDQKLQIVNDLMESLRYKRQIGYGKLFKELKKELNIDDEENEDLINIDNNEVSLSEEAKEIIALWNWERFNYYVL